MNNKQVKLGIIISYILIVCNTIYGLVISPYITFSLGETEYGVYKSIASLGASLVILDLGLGATIQRYVAYFINNDKKDQIANFVAMGIRIALILGGVILVVGIGICFLIGPAYSRSFTVEQVREARILFVMLLINFVMVVFDNVYIGVITGYNRFLFGNGVKLAKLIFRVVLVVIVLRDFPSAYFLVIIDGISTLIFLVIERIYIATCLKQKIKLTQWDRKMFFDSGKYTLFIFLTTIAAQVNHNLDNVIIGAVRTPELVTVYSYGLMLFAMFNEMATAVSSTMIPTVSEILTKEDANERIRKLIIKAGRVQFVFLGAAVTGFAILGRDFVELWLGPDFKDVYYIGLVLMIPSMLELCVNTCLAVLRAQNKLVFSTSVLMGSTLLNMVITYFLVSKWSYLGAAWGTAFSFLLGSVIVMNIYYKVELGLPMLRIYLNIFDRIWICLVLAGAAIFISSRFIYGSWLGFIINVVIFAIIYMLSLLLVGLRKDEKASLKIYFNKR